MKKYYKVFVITMLAISLWGVMSRYMDTHQTAQNKQLIIGKWENVNKQETLRFTASKVIISTGYQGPYTLNHNKLSFKNHTYTIQSLTNKRLLMTYRKGTQVHAYDYKRSS